MTVKLHGGPFDGQSAVAYGAEIGGLIDVNHRSYRITKVEVVPGWRESVASAIYIPKKVTPVKPVPAVKQAPAPE
jgi:hypothetical protein